MPFHRFAVPTYTGGLPAGYDYINNATSGTPAAVAGPRSDNGPNNGTYFVGFGEDGRSEIINRGLAALAENTDYLDNLLRKDLAIPAIFEFTATSGQTSVVLTGPGIFLGNSGHPNTTEGRLKLFQLTDDKDVNVVVTGTSTPISVASITGGSIGGGYSAGNVTLNFSSALTNGQVYRVHYKKRSNLASFLGDELLEPRISAVQTLSSRLTQLILDLANQTSVSLGSALIGSATIYDGILSHPSILNLAAGTVRSQLTTLLEAQNRNTRQRTLSSNDVIQFSDATLFLDAETNLTPFNITLPYPGNMFRQRVHLFSIDSFISEYPVTLVPTYGALIGGSPAPYVLDVPFGHWVLVTNGSDWFIG